MTYHYDPFFEDERNAQPEEQENNDAMNKVEESSLATSETAFSSPSDNTSIAVDVENSLSEEDFPPISDDVSNNSTDSVIENSLSEEISAHIPDDVSNDSTTVEMQNFFAVDERSEAKSDSNLFFRDSERGFFDDDEVKNEVSSIGKDEVISSPERKENERISPQSTFDSNNIFFGDDDTSSYGSQKSVESNPFVSYEDFNSQNGSTPQSGNNGNGGYNGGGNYNGGNGGYNGGDGGYSRTKKGAGIGVILAIMIPLLLITNIITSILVFDYVWTDAKAEFQSQLDQTLNKENSLPYNVDLIASNVSKSEIGSVLEILATNPSGVSSGTGFILTEDGYILTNAHVVTYSATIRTGIGIGSSYKTVTEISPSLVAKFENSNIEYTLTVLDYNTDLDLAVCKLENAPANLNAVEFFDSTLLNYGEPCIAIGNAQGYGLAVTEGIISNPIQYFNLSSRGYTAAIQHSAAINPGNSGGPLFNMYGMVIGINSFKLTGNSDIAIDGMGFAIPSAVAKDYVNGLNIPNLKIEYSSIAKLNTEG